MFAVVPIYYLGSGVLGVGERRRGRRVGGRGIGSEHPSKALHEGCIYLDYNATTPIFPEVSAAMQPFTLTEFGNPSSPHIYGRGCNDAVKKARASVARLIGAKEASEVVFTSCGSESDNRAVDIAIHAYHQSTLTSSGVKPHIVTCSIEHPAILVYLQSLENVGKIELTIVRVNEEGLVSAGDIQKALQNNTCLVTVMHSNNEVGSIQPIADIAKEIKMFNERKSSAGNDSMHKVLFHSDAAQSIGKVRVDVGVLGVDMLTVVGHKFGAPKGIGALYMKSELKPIVMSQPLLSGGGQEFGLRAGTENVILIVALGEASKLALEESKALLRHMLSLKKKLIVSLTARCGMLVPHRFNGPKGESSIERIEEMLHDHTNCSSLKQLPNTVSVSFCGLKVHEVIPQLLNTVAVSAGSACHAGQQGMSGVLKAMNVPVEYGLGTFRISVGRHTTEDEVDKATDLIAMAMMKILKCENKVH